MRKRLPVHNKYAWFILLFILLIMVAGCIKIGGASIQIPVNVTGDSNAGSLQFELIYDAAVLQATAVKSNLAGSDVLFEFNTDIPGRVVIGIVDDRGITGDLKVVTVTFNALKDKGSCPLEIKNAAAYQVDTLKRLPVSTISGQYNGKGDFTAPAISFGQ
jgi:hypothetical protein